MRRRHCCCCVKYQNLPVRARIVPQLTDAHCFIFFWWFLKISAEISRIDVGVATGCRGHPRVSTGSATSHDTSMATTTIVATVVPMTRAAVMSVAKTFVLTMRTTNLRGNYHPRPLLRRGGSHHRSLWKFAAVVHVSFFGRSSAGNCTATRGRTLGLQRQSPDRYIYKIHLIKGYISLHSCQILSLSETGSTVSAHRLTNITLLTLIATLLVVARGVADLYP